MLHAARDHCLIASLSVGVVLAVPFKETLKLREIFRRVIDLNCRFSGTNRTAAADAARYRRRGD